MVAPVEQERNIPALPGDGRRFQPRVSCVATGGRGDLAWWTGDTGQGWEKSNGSHHISIGVGFLAESRAVGQPWGREHLGCWEKPPASS